MFSSFGSRLTSLRRAIAGEEVDDSDDENCSYVSNVLRTYYTEKNRPYPSWLPPDPKGKIPTPTAAPQLHLVTSHSTPTFQGYGNNPNSNNASVADATPSPVNRPGGGLADLWGDTARPTAQVPQVTSLRRGRAPASASGPASPSPAPAPTTTAGQGAEGSGGYFEQAGSGGGSGAYQSPGSQRGPSAQERLRMRLHGR